MPDRKKIWDDLYKMSYYCTPTDYEIDLVEDRIRLWGMSYERAIKEVAYLMMQY